MKPLEKLFWDEIGELLHVEELLLKALPKMKEAVTAESIKEQLEEYRAQVQEDCKRVRDLFQLFEVPPREKKCDAMMGILVRGQQLMQRCGRGPSLDAALLGQARKITAYKRAAYVTAAAWAKSLQSKEAARPLDRTGAAEEKAGKAFDELVDDCHSEAAKQAEEAVRKAVVSAAARRPREVTEGARWGEW